MQISDPVHLDLTSPSCERPNHKHLIFSKVPPHSDYSEFQISEMLTFYRLLLVEKLLDIEGGDTRLSPRLIVSPLSELFGYLVKLLFA